MCNTLSGCSSLLSRRDLTGCDKTAQRMRAAGAPQAPAELSPRGRFATSVPTPHHPTLFLLGAVARERQLHMYGWMDAGSGPAPSFFRALWVWCGWNIYVGTTATAAENSSGAPALHPPRESAVRGSPISAVWGRGRRARGV